MLDPENSPLDRNRDGESAAGLADKVNFLSRADAYVPAPEAVVTRETHMSWVFMAGDLVYKLKKPVRFPYLDFSTIERRAAACRAEYDLNRRLAKDIYLGVAPLTATTGGYAIGGSGPIVDWLVVMRRLGEHQTLNAALAARHVSQAQVQRLADILIRFYTHAARVPISSDDYLLSLHKAILADQRVLFRPIFDLARGTIGRIVNVQRRFLLQRRELLAERVHHRLIRDGHGDLRPEHIWLNAPYPIIDCLEFDARLRASDALDELAFLHLECERLGGRWVGAALRRRLALLLRDDPANGLFLFYRIGRAMLRARLSIAHLADGHPRTPEKWPRLTRTYLALARADATRLERLLAGKAVPQSAWIKTDRAADR